MALACKKDGIMVLCSWKKNGGDQYQAVQPAQHRKWSSMLIIALACKKDEIMERCSWKKKAGEPMSENRTRPAPA